MKYWLWYHEGNEYVKEIARFAEAMGYAGIAKPDHVAIPADYQSPHPSGRRMVEADSSFPDPLMTFAMMAAVTSKLRFMTYVYVLPMRDPFSAAKQAGTLAALSNQRFVFGVGAGWNKEEIELLGHDARTRGRRMDEMLLIMQQLWADGRSEFEGEFYRFGPVGQFPVPGRVPVWVGGKSPSALRRAAGQDGWLGMNYPMEEIRPLLKQLDAERERIEQDRGPSPFGRFVIPLGEINRGVYHQLEDWGVDNTLAIAWPPGSRSHASLDARLEAMEKFADRFIRILH